MIEFQVIIFRTNSFRTYYWPHRLWFVAAPLWGKVSV